jgi:hypothetical protein
MTVHCAETRAGANTSGTNRPRPTCRFPLCNPQHHTIRKALRGWYMLQAMPQILLYHSDIHVVLF